MDNGNSFENGAASGQQAEVRLVPRTNLSTVIDILLQPVDVHALSTSLRSWQGQLNKVGTRCVFGVFAILNLLSVNRRQKVCGGCVHVSVAECGGAGER